MSIVKFKVEFHSAEPPQDGRVALLRDWCRRFNEKGLTPLFQGTGRSLGNLSFRISPNSPEFIITGSTLDSKKDLSDADFVKVIHADAASGTVVAEGSRDPSSESIMHYEIYKHRPDVGAIFHGHDKQITSAAAALGILETGKEELPGTVELMKQVMAVMGRDKFIVMKNHGFLSLGESMDEAGNLALQMKVKINE
jgi:ribulose-5-phosphate 4-epimerase/fuculose-1-phosphate aldolase